MRNRHIEKHLLRCLLVVSILIYGNESNAQNFTNPDLEGVVFGGSTLPDGWEAVPVGDPVSDATNTNIGDTPDLTSFNQPNATLGLRGTPFSGDTFMSGAITDNNVYFHEGIQQTVSGFTVGDTYIINFYQAVVKQIAGLDGSGSWSVYMDNTLLSVSEVSTSDLAYNDPDLIWEQRVVSFTPTSTTHTFKFMPTDDDTNLGYSFDDEEAGLRMGIDLITIDTSCTLNFGDDLTICEADLPFELGTAIDGTYTWSTGEDTQSIEITESGTYSLEVVADCGTVFDEITIEIVPALENLELGEDLTVCPDEFPITLEAPPGGNYIWSNGGTTASITVSDPGTYFVFYSSSCESQFDDITIESSLDGPSLDLGEDIIACESDLPLVIGTTLDGTYEWNTGELTSFIEVTENGTYTLELETSCGVVSDDISVEIISAVVPFDLGEDLEVCSDDFPINLEVSSAGDYSWNTSEMTSSIEVNSPGTYSVTVSNACGSLFDEIDISLLEENPSLNLGPDLVLCIQDFPFIIDAGVFDSHAWNTGEETQLYTIEEPGDFSVTVTNTCGQASDGITVALADTPAPFDLGDDITICENNFPLTLAIPETDFTISWTTGSNEASIDVSQGGNYGVEVSNQCGTVSSSVNVISIPNEVASEEFVLCQGESVDFLGETFNETGIYEVTVPADEQTFCDAFWNIEVLVIPQDTIVTVLQLDEDQEATYGDIIFDEAGTYSITETAENGCDRIVEIIVEDTGELFVYVPNAFTPDNDGLNEIFGPVMTLVGGIDLTFFEFQIYDRWGALVHEALDYESSGWNGSGASTGDYYVQDGVYTWVLRYATSENVERKETFGSVVVLR